MECPICLEIVDVSKNCVVTECGHSFHCACLMRNAVTNGFGCPMCRTAMAEEPEDDDDDDDDDDSEDDYDSLFSDDSEEEQEEVDMDFSDLFQEDEDPLEVGSERTLEVGSERTLEERTLDTMDNDSESRAEPLETLDNEDTASEWSDVESESDLVVPDEEAEAEVVVPNPSDIADFLKSKGVTFDMLLNITLFENYIGYAKVIGKNECKRSFGIVNNNIEKYLVKAKQGRLNDIVRPVKNRVAGSGAATAPATAATAKKMFVSQEKCIARVVAEEL